MVIFPSLRGFQLGWLRGDLIAGFTVWAVLIPESLAYASIAGVDPVVGLYAAPAALLLYAMFGSSRLLVVGPMSATAAVSAAVVGGIAGSGAGFAALTAALAITVGMICLLAGLLKLGFVAGFISEPVLKGFIVGLALTIIMGQVPKLFGVPKGEGNFFEQLWDVVTHLGDTHGWTLLVGALSLLLVLLLKHYLPLLPASLIVVVLGVLAVVVFGLESKGVSVVGYIQSGLPQVGLPEVKVADYLTLAGGAVGIALVGFAEGLGAAKTYATRDGYTIDANKELCGLGAANLGAGLCSGMVVNGSLSKTAVNGGAGAKSQISGLTVAVLTVITLLFLTGLFEKLPEATLAAVVIAAVIELVNIPSIVRLYRLWTARLGRIYGPAARADFIAALAALAGVLLFDTLPGLFIGIGVSILLLVYRASRPHIAELGRLPGNHWADTDRNPDAVPDPRVAVVRVESGLFFANADRVRAAITKAAARDGVTAVVLDAEAIPEIDLTAAEMLTELTRSLAGQGIPLHLAHGIGQVRDVLRAQNDSPHQVYPSVEAAVAAARDTS